MQYGSDGIQQGKDEAPLFSVIVVVALMGTMAWGLWRARYWAVLGFQALMVIVMITGSLFLIQAMSWAEALVTTGLIAGAGRIVLLHDQGDGPHPDAAPAGIRATCIQGLIARLIESNACLTPST